MTKTKKRIAIICMVLNIILLSQICFGSVSAFYDAVTGSEVEDQHICGECEHEDAELQAESVCTQEELENAKCGHVHGWYESGGGTGCPAGFVGCTGKYTTYRCNGCPSTKKVCAGGHTIIV